MQHVCVTGMGCVCAAGNSPTSVWQNLVAPNPTRVDASLLHHNALPYPFFAAPASAFGSDKHARRRSAADVLHLGLFAARQALLQACVPSIKKVQDLQHCKNIEEKLPAIADLAHLMHDLGRLNIVLGTTAGSALHFLDGYAARREDITASTPDIEEYYASNLALFMGQALKTHGATITIANACTSGADAIGLAIDMIRQGQCDTVLCGGADALSLVPHTGFARLMIYSNSPCRPFDAERCGLNLGEGAGMLILESEAHARARQAIIIGRIVGYGGAVDAHHFTAPHPEAKGLALSVENALSDAAISADELAFINAHGTATMENDKVEGGYCLRTFPSIPVWATKGITGHTLGAAGALEAIFSIMALNHALLPRTHGFHNPDPSIMLIPTLKHTSITKKYALSRTSAVGGNNHHRGEEPPLFVVGDDSAKKHYHHNGGGHIVHYG